MSEQPGKSETTVDLTGITDPDEKARESAAAEKNGTTEGGEGSPEKLYGGKFKTVEELEAAFAEATKEPAADPQNASAKPETIPEDDAAVADALKGAGLDSEAFAKEFAESGDLGEASRAALEKAGYSKEVVDVYLDGLRARASSYSSSVYAPAGGEAGYKQLVQWASTNLNAEQKRAFNEAVTSGDAERAGLAVQGLVSLRGGAGRLINGKSGSQEPAIKPFASTAQVVSAMRDRRYHTDPAYRKEVSDRLAVSSVF